MKKLTFILLLLPSLGFAQSQSMPNCPSPQVLISGYAQSFILDTAISDANITVLETNQQALTDSNGRFSFCVFPHTWMTLTLTKKSLWPWDNYLTTQTASYWVPETGFVGPYHEITFQVPRMTTYDLLKDIIKEERDATVNPNACTLVTTIAGYHKTLKDDPQGVAGAKLVLDYNGHDITSAFNPFYFGIVAGKTNPFTPGRDVTSKDGGVLIYNLIPSNNYYDISASKKGVKFSSAYVWCRPGSFINVSPPQGPTVILKKR